MIFAVDFDGTIVDHEFPEIGREKPGAISVLKALQKEGHKIIIWTCRCEPWLGPVTAWLAAHAFCPDAINSNIENVPGFAMPKILADVYIDDRNFPPFKSWEDVRCAFLGGP
jgi:hypothetical protein